MDLGSTNKTFLNVSDTNLYILFAFIVCSLVFRFKKKGYGYFRVDSVLTFFLFFWLLQEVAIEPQRYYELHEKDTIKFGNSR